ncbi:MAG: rod shape-determining protein RodA [Candidatus Liptonbacteria bacterium]|nr:rod shape-determining protein RodA [Candidatus Liptonbacteria bacterium]
MRQSGSVASLLIPIGILGAGSALILSSISLNLFWSQLLWYAIGIGIFFALPRFDWRSFVNYPWAIFGMYGVAVLSLVLTRLFAPSIRGAESWLVIGPVQIQTAEFAKAALILVFASFFAKQHARIAWVRTILSSFALFAIPFFLIMLQPDLGSALVFFGIWLGFLAVSGIRLRHLLAIAAICTVAGAVGWQYGLEQYQKERIIGFVFPERDQLGINYNVTQSKIAIGSAGLFGKGYGRGTQVQLGFLPEVSADFTLAGLVEEWGLVAGLAVLGAMTALIVNILSIGSAARNNFDKFFCLGTAILLVVHVFMNAGSVMGLTPVIGVPFPFLSYGGSNTLTVFFLVGMIYAIKRHS